MADILIRGMGLPEEGEYHMTLYVCPNGDAYIDVPSFPVEEDRFKVIPLPERHGRLIDENYLLALISDEEHFGCLNVSDILNAPTIVPAEGDADNG